MRLARVLGVVGRLLRMFSPGFAVPLLLGTYDGFYGGETAGNAAGVGRTLTASGWNGAWDGGFPFLAGGIITWVAGFILSRGLKGDEGFRRSEAFGIVGFSWLFVALFGAIPYLLEGLSTVDAWFESMSGFTTTGATILTNFESHTRAFFLWRGMSQWIGGLGVIALFVVVLPQLRIGGRQLFFAEASSGVPGEVISPKIQESARRLWILYGFLTVLVITLLHVVAKLPLFDALCHGLTTVSAGGFSPHPGSVGGYANPTAEWILIPFMLIAGISFPLLWVVFSRKPLEFFRDGELRFYLLSAGIGAAGIAWILTSKGIPGEAEIRPALFQAASLSTGTGYASADYVHWASGAKVLLIAVMLVGGCAGSAAGGAKAVRNLLTLKFLRREITRALHPRAVLPLTHKGQPVPEEAMRGIVHLVTLYLAGYVFFGTLVALTAQVDLVSSFSAALACLGNIGPAFGSLGPMGNYADLPSVTKLILAGTMWLGRLEIVTLLALLHPHVWTRLRWHGNRE